MNSQENNLKTQPQFENLIILEEHYQVATYKKFPFVIERGEDVWVYTTDGGNAVVLDKTLAFANRQRGFAHHSTHPIGRTGSSNGGWRPMLASAERIC